jgi:hypothetical protein
MPRAREDPGTTWKLASYFGSEVSRELTAEVEGWQMEGSQAWELAAGGSTG